MHEANEIANEYYEESFSVYTYMGWIIIIFTVSYNIMYFFSNFCDRLNVIQDG